jgi:competence protein ComEA
MKNWLNQNFGFTKREYNGLLALMAILLLVSSFPYFYGYFFTKPPSMSVTEKVALQQLILVNEAQAKNYHYAAHFEEKVAATPRLFKFDPNEIGLAEWQQLGLSLKQAQSIINYRNKGGKFYRPADLKRMYTISAAMFATLAPYIAIESNDARVAHKGFIDFKPRQKELKIIELNNADTLQLDQINGIGAAFARRIVKYRDKLGGFYRKEQLLEVFGLDSAKLLEIENQIVLDIKSLKKININTASFDELKGHPYLKYKQINAIIQYRNQHGRYNSIDDLKKVAILPPLTIQNLAPYLNFQ